MKNPTPDHETVAKHEELFETQMSLQSRMLEYIEKTGGFDVFEEAWDEFNLYEDKPMDVDDLEPALHFFPWALFYWRRDVPERLLQEAIDAMRLGDVQSHDSKAIGNQDDDKDDDNWLQEIEALSDQEIDEILSGTEDDEYDDDDFLDEDDLDDDEDEEEPYIALPPIAVMFINSADGADGPDSQAASVGLTVKDRRFIEAAAQAPYSFFKVAAVGPGSFVTLQDMIVPAQMQVYGEDLVDMLEEDDVIYGQVVAVDSAHLLCGMAPAVLPPIVHEPIEEARMRLEELRAEMGEDWRHELEFEMRALFQSLVTQLQELDDEQSAE